MILPLIIELLLVLYINYFEPIPDKEERTKLKKELGETILVFPAHSISGMKRLFNETELINNVRRTYPTAKTVIVSLYYIDFLSSKKEEFEKLDCIVLPAVISSIIFF